MRRVDAPGAVPHAQHRRRPTTPVKTPAARIEHTTRTRGDEVRGALYREVGKPLEIHDDLEIDDPREGEVQIRFAATGVCHSDLSLRDGHFPFPMPSPSVLGHEGAGEI